MKTKIFIISFMILGISALGISLSHKPNINAVTKDKVEALSNLTNDVWQEFVIDQAEKDWFIVVPPSQSFSLSLTVKIKGVPVTLDLTVPIISRIYCCAAGYNACRPLAPDMHPAACKTHSKGLPFWE